jgi:hypothetical protein
MNTVKERRVKERRDDHDEHRGKPASRSICGLRVSIVLYQSYWKKLPSLRCYVM